jgi:MFS family permease
MSGESPPSAGRRGPTGWRTATAAFESPQFRWIFSSNMLFFLAMGGQSAVRPWLAFQLTDSELALGITSAAVAIPMLALAPFGGALADRFERRGMIMRAQAMVVAAEATVLALLLTGSLAFWQLVAMTFVLGCAFPLMMPARQAIVANIVGRGGIGNAMAVNMAGMNLTRVVGPVGAGVLIAAIGIEGVYIVNLSLYALAIAAMLGVLRFPPPETARAISIRRNMGDGFRYVGSHRLILLLLLYGLVPMFLAMPFQSLLVVFADDVWEVGSTGYGFLSGASGLGGVVGSIWVASRAKADRAHAMLYSALAFCGLLMAFSLCPWFYPAIGLVFFSNIFASAFGTFNNTAIQLLIPDAVRGRISSFLMMSFSLPLLGTLPVAAVAERFGAPAAVGAASGLAMLTALGFYACSRDLRELDEHVRRAEAEGAPVSRP